jgi:signal transduction histidine kinase
VQESGDIAARLRAAGMFTGGPERGWATAARDVLQALRDAPSGGALGLVAAHAREGAGADLGAVLVPGPGDTVVIEAAAGHGAELLRGVTRPAGRMWETMLASGLAAAADSSLDPGAADLAGPLRLGPMLMVPLVAAGRLLGGLALARVRNRPAFTPPDLAAATIFAGYAALALVWVEERRQREGHDGVAADLHDLVLGRLFATGLRLQALPAGDLGAGAPAVAAAIAELDRAMADIRAAIQALRLPADPVPRS